MKLEGTLGLFSLRELIEMSVYSSVRGVLNLEATGGAAQIFFRDGVAYHCVYGDLVGEAALAALFEEQDASFAFEADAATAESTLWGDIEDLMDRCEQQAARWREVRAALPTTELVPVLISNPGHENMSIETAHFAMLAGVDGERTLGAIADEFGLDLLDVCEAAIKLRRDGLLHLRPAPPRPPKPSTPSRANGGVIDRILAAVPSVAAPAPGDGDPTRLYVRPALSAEEERILRLLRG